MQEGTKFIVTITRLIGMGNKNALKKNKIIDNFCNFIF